MGKSFAESIGDIEIERIKLEMNEPLLEGNVDYRGDALRICASIAGLTQRLLWREHQPSEIKAALELFARVQSTIDYTVDSDLLETDNAIMLSRKRIVEKWGHLFELEREHV